MRADVPRLMSNSSDRMETKIPCLTNSWFDHRQTDKLFFDETGWKSRRQNTITSCLTWKWNQLFRHWLSCPNNVTIVSFREQPNVFTSLSRHLATPIYDDLTYLHILGINHQSHDLNSSDTNTLVCHRGKKEIQKRTEKEKELVRWSAPSTCLSQLQISLV